MRETDRLVHLTYRRASARTAGSARRGEKGGESSGDDDPDHASATVGTPEHPFWSLTRDCWVNLGELQPGERLSLTTGPATVTAVRVEVLSEPVKVYNFQVAEWHTFCAAPEADKPFVWVHEAKRLRFAGVQREPSVSKSGR